MAEEWYNEPYKGGPMVAVPGFPRSLYPPDAAEDGYTPSIDGPDVEAYKRTVWRAHRWPGPATDFDQAFNNAFSQGKSNNVGESGIAGIQRQQNLDVTGYVGEKTFNTLRSILVPIGPHKGEPAMDSNAQNLIAEAYALFNQPPDPPKKETTRQRALSMAISQLGYTEDPPESNDTKYGEWYGVNYQPWCAIFQTWCFAQVGGSPSFDRTKNRYAYVPYVVTDAKANRYGLSVTTKPQPGDLVCYDWDYDGEYDHIGLYEQTLPTPNAFSAIEGNTSTSNQSNGGQVMRRERDLSDAGVVFVHVK